MLETLLSNRTVSVLWEALPRILSAGLTMTIPLTLVSFTLAMVLAVAVALVQYAKVPVLSQLARFYIWVIRGTPLLVQLFIIFYGLPSMGIMLDAFPAAVIAFAFNEGAYCAETMRGALESVPQGQLEAGYCVGMSWWQIMRRIVLPQALRTAVPALSNSLIGMIKDTSLASNITVAELFMAGQRVAARTYIFLPIYCEVAVKSHSSKELTSSVYFYVDTKILANAAKMFNKTEDYKYYSALANKIKNAINDKFLNRETGIYGSGVQTEQSVPLQWGIVPEELKRKVARNLAKQVEAAGFHLDVGVLGAKAILNALSENGEAETAYKLAAQDTYPSWGCWIANGATTLLENWDLNATRDISDNHMMFGEIGGWFYKGLGGIFPDPENPGFKHILLRPNFPSGLNELEARYQSPYGEICSKWERKKNRIVYHVTVPANSTATFYAPDNVKGERAVKLEAGKHILELPIKRAVY